MCWVNQTPLVMASTETVGCPGGTPVTVTMGLHWFLGHTLFVPAQLAWSILTEQLATCGIRWGHRVEGKDVESEEV
jgi:hypothetical protein